MLSDRALSNFTRFMQSRGIRPRDFGPGGAYDSMPRRARDDEPAPNAIEAMMELRDKMSPEGFRALCQELCGGQAEDGEKYATPEDRADAESFPDVRKAATDEPPFFKGRPRTGGAMDAMAFDGPPRRKSQADKSFENMYGSAALNIKNADLYPTATRVRT
jgi:hypothetical protein